MGIDSRENDSFKDFGQKVKVRNWSVAGKVVMWKIVLLE